MALELRAQSPVGPVSCGASNFHLEVCGFLFACTEVCSFYFSSWYHEVKVPGVMGSKGGPCMSKMESIQDGSQSTKSYLSSPTPLATNIPGEEQRGMYLISLELGESLSQKKHSCLPAK